MVKFKSDVTFNTGSAELKPKARTAIARFAQILNSPAAAGYELKVAGHTDSQPVSNPATMKAGPPRQLVPVEPPRDLGRQGAAEPAREPQRIAVVGYADQHPIASNANDAGRRRTAGSKC